LEQYSLLKQINYDMARKLFAEIYKDKLIDVKAR
jgi:hypothetical protein